MAIWSKSVFLNEVHVRCRNLCLLLILSILWISGCRRTVRNEPAAQEAPLLLLEDSRADLLSGQKGVDNSRCHVCHLNFAMEDLSVKHAAANVGCERCHGSSNAHCADEDNITPPDRMFPRDGISDACQECHRQELPMTAEHKDLLAGKSKKVCTDCHGEHRLSHRTRRWDRHTGTLISDDNVRMMTDEMLGEN